MKVYVHVPFCHSKCAYCDFYSTPRRELMEAYVDTVGEEWKAMGGGAVPDTIYLGGGTPSSLPVELLDRLIEGIPAPAPLREFTIEANPEDVTRGWVKHLVTNTRIDRVSMGIQTFDDSTLSFLGRRHTGAQAEEAVRALREGGIDNLSCDLIYGLPGQTLEGWKANLDRLLSLRPEHISAYLLSYEPRTRLGVMLSKGKVTEASDRLAEEMYSYLCRATREAGYEHYEISNFALPGRNAVHNSSYWDGSDYIGLGPGAHSMAGGVRWYNPSDLKGYIQSGGHGFRIIDKEDGMNRYNDMLITALRTSAGLDPEAIPQEFKASFNASSARLLENGNLIITPAGWVAIPEDKWLTSNTILLELIEV
ncbi:MAG: radical SAM family heme chaperone HemW [Paenibacillus sp.]|nr:radical SAM family heme chaperone HemW [Paenibacillus sp.]